MFHFAKILIATVSCIIYDITILDVHVYIADVAGQGHKTYQSVSMWPGTINLFHPKLLVRNANHSVSL
jgi:hypothetical protein